MQSNKRFSDSGVIKCVATNILGRAVSTAHLAIEGELMEECKLGLLIFGFYFTSKTLVVKVHLLVNRNNIVKKT